MYIHISMYVMYVYLYICIYAYVCLGERQGGSQAANEGSSPAHIDTYMNTDIQPPLHIRTYVQIYTKGDHRRMRILRGRLARLALLPPTMLLALFPLTPKINKQKLI